MRKTLKDSKWFRYVAQALDRALGHRKRDEGKERQLSSHMPLVFLLCLALVRGLLYLSTVPPWGHYDEPTHFEYAWLIANRPALPQVGDYDQNMRREVAASMVEHRFFRDLEFRSNLLIQDEPVWIGIPELVHPPFYYLFLAFPLRIVRHADVVSQLHVARLVSLLLYLCSIWIGYRLLGELVAPGHPLRWAVPGMMAFLPAYTDLMTAINNDVGAVVLFSLFLWGGVRTIVRGASLFRLVWVLGTAALCVWTKNIAAVAVVLVPVVLVLALVRGTWKRWMWVGILAAGLSLGIVLFSWGDAAAWYRHTLQANPTSQDVANAPLGRKAIALEIAAGEPRQQVSQYLPEKDVEALPGVTVTLGAWVWATQPAQIRSPMLYDGQRAAWRQVQVGVTPTFYAITTAISVDADYVQVILRPSVGQTPQDGIDVYYDGIVLAVGEWPQDTPPSFHDATGDAGTWDGRPFVNRVRNGSAEVAWPRTRPWVDRRLQKYARRSPSQYLTSILDWERTGWVYKVTATRLFQSFWARFGWNQAGLSAGWYWILAVVTALGALGTVVTWIRAHRLGRPVSWMRAVGLLVLAGLLLWANAFLRPHPVYPNPYLPVARYAYPAIVPTVSALATGWWALTPKRLRRWFLLGMFSALGVLDVASLWTIWTFFYGR